MQNSDLKKQIIARIEAVSDEKLLCQIADLLDINETQQQEKSNFSSGENLTSQYSPLDFDEDENDNNDLTDKDLRRFIGCGA